MTEAVSGTRPREACGTGWEIALQAFFALAALGQIAYLARWPMYLFGASVPQAAGLAVAFLRLGVYAALSLGLGQRHPVAWAGAIAELWRSALLMVLMLSAQQRWHLSGFLYPAEWTQGALGAALPILVALNVALALGWTPGGEAETCAGIAARLLALGCAIGAVRLRGLGPRFGVGKKDQNRALARDGLPFVLVLTLAEIGAALAA